MEASLANQEIAIIGISCRVAGANSPSKLWQLLASSKDVQSEITRFNARGFYHSKGGSLKGLSNVKDAYMLDDNLIDRFDNSFFRITPQEAACIDPQQRMLLEIAYEAVENAGVLLDDFVGSNTGVYAGMEGSDYHTILARNLDTTPKYLATGTPGSFAANRISYSFNLSGPSMVIDSACSSSMSALHQGVRALQLSECEMALVCGAKLILNPDMFMPSSELGFLSPDGKCKTFDANADGYGRGEGALALLVRPLKDAIRCNDPIRAILRGTRLNQDGRTQGITLPSSTAQKHNMTALYKQLGLATSDIQYLEAHGTGTSAGDRLEVSAINNVFQAYERTEPLIIGSVKSNVGHLESSSALVAIVKTVEAMERGKIPPQLNLKSLNPQIDFSRLQIPTQMLEWPQPRPGCARIAAVNSFGAGGSNGHAVLESHSLPSQPISKNMSRPLLFKLSAQTEKVLHEMTGNLAAYCEEEQPDLRQLAYTLGSRRPTMAKTTYFIAKNHSELLERLRSQSSEIFARSGLASSPVVLIFTGQGAQWPGMGKDLLDGSPLFRSVISRCQKILNTLPDRPQWIIAEELAKPAEVSNVYSSSFSQPLCTILQLGLVELLRFWKLATYAVIGHSSGEIAAAYAAGMISFKDAVIIAYYRGLYLSSLAAKADEREPRGSMCAVSLGQDKAKAFISVYSGRVDIAAVNSPSNCTLSGDTEDIHSIIEHAKQKGIFCRELRVDTAFHSFHVLPAAKRYEAALAATNISFTGPAKCIMVSSVNGTSINSEDLNPKYWADNMVQPVLFASALEECLQRCKSAPVLLEIGPHPALKAPSMEIARSIGLELPLYLASCTRGRPAYDTLLQSASELLVKGIGLDPDMVNNVEDDLDAALPRVLTDLPPYPWDHSTSFWFETDVSKSVRFRKHRRHLLLGSRALDDSKSFPCWRNHLKLDELPKLKEAVAGLPSIDVRSGMYIAMIVEAASQLQMDYHRNLSWKVSSIKLPKPSLTVDFLRTNGEVNLHLNAQDIEGNGEYIFYVLALSDVPNRECSGEIKFRADNVPGLERSLSIVHDPSLRQAAEWLDFDASIPSTLKDVQISALGCEGLFEHSVEFHEDIDAKLQVLQAVLCLIPISTATILVPGKSNVISIGSITSCQNRAHSASKNHFNVSTTTLNGTRSCSNIRIFYENGVLIITNLMIEVDRSQAVKPPLGALFSTPSLSPDISQLSGSKIESFHHLLDLALHKWPKADIGLLGFKDERLLRNLVTRITRQRRANHRSVLVQHPGLLNMTSSKVRFVENMSDAVGLHLLFFENTLDLDIEKIVHHEGVVCGPRSVDVEDRFEAFARFPVPENQDWVVYRWRHTKKSPRIPVRPVIFTDKPPTNTREYHLDSEVVRLEPSLVTQFCERNLSEKYSAAVIESSEKSVVTTWPGKDLVPWLRHMLWWASSIIWITRSWRANPFHGTAGILLRTLQAEQPSIKVTWIVCGEGESDEVALQRVQGAYSSFSKNANEIRHDWTRGNPEILRYIPDDRLSASVGLTPPLTFESISLDSEVSHVIVQYTERKSLLGADGIYVVVGGLGGLGRYVCGWMASHGARRLAIVSRSATASPEAQKTVDDLQRLGVSITLFKADASDRSAVGSAFAELRKEGSIKGIINMALILEDVPLASMTGDQWDRCLRLKVDSSWSLHEITLDDKLDFFILFSSIASVLGNRNQANYNVGNGFLNALAEYRHTLGLPAVSIALGAMTEIGVLHEAGINDLLGYLSRTALTPLTPFDLGKILEAAVLESPRRERPVIVTGLEMLERINGKIVGNQDQTQLIWTEWPEFGHLQDHKLIEQDTDSSKNLSLRQRVASMSDQHLMLRTILEAFVAFLSKLQGFDLSSQDPDAALASYGLDSLSAVSCQFWFHRELGLDISAGEVLTATSPSHLAKLASGRFEK